MEYYIVSWNDEYLDMAILAGPMSQDRCRRMLRDIVTQRLCELYDEFKGNRKKAEAAYDLAFNSSEDDAVSNEFGVDLHVSQIGASLCYSSYEDRYQIVAYIPKTVS